MPHQEFLSLKGVSENNLKHVSLEIPHDQLIVISGVSGSGKSTLAFDTIYAEGGRRYIETFSPYTRQFLQRLHRPALEQVSGVRSSLALEQRNSAVNSRSTVGTVTEINDYLKLLWGKRSVLFCPDCNEQVQKGGARVALEQLLLACDSESLLYVTAPVLFAGGAKTESFQASLQSAGFVRYFDLEKKQAFPIEDLSSTALKPESSVLVIIDRIRLSGAISAKKRQQLLLSFQQAFEVGRGQMLALVESERGIVERSFHEGYVCDGCGTIYREPSPALFNFNSPVGACQTCQGFGKVLEIDPKLCIADPLKSIDEGAVHCWTTDATSWERAELLKFCKREGISRNTPWKKLSKANQRLIFEGKESSNYFGILGWFKWLEKKKYKMHVRVLLSRYRKECICPQCEGTRLQSLARSYKIKKRSLPEIWNTPVDDLREFFLEISESHPQWEKEDSVLGELCSRLEYLQRIGLGYLTLDRQTKTLSGGEFQRVNLTAILGSQLVNTMLVLDEPTIGLHARDTARLISAMAELRDRGNTVVVVEHDREVIAAANQVLDIGPQAGSGGGSIVYQGSFAGLQECKTSLTAQYISGNITPERTARAESTGEEIKLEGCSANNLRNVSVSFPLHQLVVVTGVSGSGKSSLVEDCLIAAVRAVKQGAKPKKLSTYRELPVFSATGFELVDDIVLVDQSPVGRTPRSNPAAYTKAWEVVRELLASTPDAERLALSKSAFSFNVDGGRCPDCSGAGQHRVEMQFLADVYVDCEVCQGRRFQEAVLSVRYRGKNVTDFLSMAIADAIDFFKAESESALAEIVCARLQPLVDLGLGYLSLGHPLNKLSGGEAQRLKLASYLSELSVKKGVLLVLDEPTTGLHLHNVQELLTTFEHLLERGHSIVCVEHNLDIIRAADWLIDLGPEAGAAGGTVVATGTPKQFLSSQQIQKHSYTARSLKQEGLSSKATARSEIASPTNVVHQPIRIIGARHHNLKNISISVPQGLFTVISGVSGSGKSSLAFDIIFAEGQRRYIDCLSPYARQFIKQLERADVDSIESIPPTVALSQKTAPPLGISTIATTTEIYQYLRLLYAKVGTQVCPQHDEIIATVDAETLSVDLATQYDQQRVYLFAPVVSGRKGFHNELIRRALAAEITEARIDDRVVKLSEDMRLERHSLHWISLLVASLKVSASNASLLKQAIEQCLLLGNGSVELAVGDKHGELQVLSLSRACPACGRGFHQLDPQDFSFRSSRGVCKKCDGRGHLGDEVDRGKICPECKGARIGEIGRSVLVGGKRIHELTQYTAPGLIEFLDACDYDPRFEPVIGPIVYELRARLRVLCEVGLTYLELDRESASISGGEAQRLRLARTLGSPLTGVCYVLDEPTIGLHRSEHKKLMEVLTRLRDEGNTLVVVEHDEDTIRAADHVIDIGPVGGAHGGHVVAAGNVSAIEQCAQSITGAELKKRTTGKMQWSTRTFTKETEWLKLTGASVHNLRDVSVSIPLGALTVVAGVSGAGKSSLVHGTLVPAVLAAFDRQKKPKKNEVWHFRKLEGHESLERFVEIDQSPVGKTSSSTPASYLDVLGEIRKLFAKTSEAQIRGWSAAHFSFNSGKGRCSNCEGRGFNKVPMSFLPDAIVPCEVCEGNRFEAETLEVLYQGLSLGAVLRLTLDQAVLHFANHRKIAKPLQYACDLGVGYIQLGQATHTLSGGESQRLKIARELASKKASQVLYVLDEPTTGLHMADVNKLLSVLRRLVQLGNTVVVIEHDLDLIHAADFLIELGPGPGEAGGSLLFSGTPLELKKSNFITPTSQYL